MNAGMVGNAANHALEKKTMNDNEKTLNMQKFLNKHYNAGLVEDGRYGTKTREAVRKMQQELGITADGWWGTETQKAVANANNGMSPTVSNIRYNGQQRTSYDDLKFLYKNPPQEDIASTNTATTATTTNNVSSPASQSKNLNGWNAGSGPIPLFFNWVGDQITKQPGNGEKRVYESNKLIPTLIRRNRYSWPGMATMRYGGKILMSFVTKKQ